MIGQYIMVHVFAGVHMSVIVCSSVVFTRSFFRMPFDALAQYDSRDDVLDGITLQHPKVRKAKRRIITLVRKKTKWRVFVVVFFNSTRMHGKVTRVV